MDKIALISIICLIFTILVITIEMDKNKQLELEINKLELQLKNEKLDCQIKELLVLKNIIKHNDSLIQLHNNK